MLLWFGRVKFSALAVDCRLADSWAAATGRGMCWCQTCHLFLLFLLPAAACCCLLPLAADGSWWAVFLSSPIVALLV